MFSTHVCETGGFFRNAPTEAPTFRGKPGPVEQRVAKATEAEIS